MRPAKSQAGFTLPALQGGFTLIEMIAVLAVLALVASLVLARGPQRSATLEMRTATATVARTLRLARTRAIAANRPIPVTFDVRTATFRLGDAPAQSLPPQIQIAVTASEDQGARILFLPDGSSTGGHIDLQSPSAAGRVGVDWLTGRVSVAPTARERSSTDGT